MPVQKRSSNRRTSILARSPPQQHFSKIMFAAACASAFSSATFLKNQMFAVLPHT
jgi:hypothetical protein